MMVSLSRCAVIGHVHEGNASVLVGHLLWCPCFLTEWLLCGFLFVFQCCCSEQLPLILRAVYPFTSPEGSFV